MRHLVVEGPDGGGKTRLIEALVSKYPHIERAKKASTSTRGPVRNLAAWVRAEFDVMDDHRCGGPLIYDRHPVISEPIYGPIARDGAQPGFTPSPWLSTARLGMYERTYVIWCIPSLEQCQSAIDPERDMPGVVENIDAIHAAYLRAMTEWGGPGIRYNLNLMLSRDVLPDGLFAGAVQFVDEYGAMLEGQVGF